MMSSAGEILFDYPTSEINAAVWSFDVRGAQIAWTQMSIGGKTGSLMVMDRRDRSISDLQCDALTLPMAVALGESEIYVYDAVESAVLCLDYEGTVMHRIDAPFSPTDVRKLDIDQTGIVYLHTCRFTQDNRLYLFTPDLQPRQVIGGEEFESQVKQVEVPAQQHQARRRIHDFCFGENGLLYIKTEPQRLCEYDLAQSRPVRVRNIGDYCAFIQRSDRTIFYLSENGTPAKDRSPRDFFPRGELIGRLHMDDGEWSTDFYEAESHVPGIPIPLYEENWEHFGFRLRDDYFYFLDLEMPRVPSEARLQDSRSRLYRMALEEGGAA